MSLKDFYGVVLSVRGSMSVSSGGKAAMLSPSLGILNTKEHYVAREPVNLAFAVIGFGMVEISIKGSVKG